MEPDLFGLVAEVARSLCEDGLGTIHSRSHQYGTKVWFDADKPPPSYFEAQVMGRRDIDGEKGIAIEIGWHGEARKEQENELLIQALMEREYRWRKPSATRPKRVSASTRPSGDESARPGSIQT